MSPEFASQPVLYLPINILRMVISERDLPTGPRASGGHAPFLVSLCYLPRGWDNALTASSWTVTMDRVPNKYVSKIHVLNEVAEGWE